MTAARGNPVHALHARLADAIGVETGPARGQSTYRPFTAILTRVLTELGLSATARQLAEAVPYLEDIADIDEFRAVLLRLGIESKRLNVRPKDLKPHHLPCLIRVKDEAVPCLVVGLDGSGNLLVADEAQSIPRRISRGTVFFVSVAGSARHDAQRAGWVRPLLFSFAPILKELLSISLLLSLSGVAASFLVMGIYDFAIASRSLDTLAFLIAGAVGVMSLEVVLRRRRSRGIARMSARFDALVSIETYQQVLALPLAYTDGAKLSSQLARLRQFQIGRSLFSGPFAAALLDLPFTLISLGVLFALAGWLAFVAVALGAILVLALYVLAPLMAARARASSDAKNEADAILVDIATKLNTIRSTSTEDVQHKRAVSAYASSLALRHRSQSLEAAVQASAFALMNIAGASILILGAVRVMNDTLTIGALSAIMVIVWRIFMPLQSVATGMLRMKQAAQTLAQIDQLMQMKPERSAVVRSTAGAKVNVSGDIRLNSVTLRYPGRSDFSLKQVSLVLQRCKFIAITGPSGAGKSTLIKSILGLYQPQMGAISVDGADLRHVDMQAYRQSVLYVPQETRVFYGTLAQNIRLTVPEASDQDIIAALQTMGLTMPHSDFPQGIDTRLRGRAQSRGAAAIHQKIALSAMLVSHRPIVLLDMPEQHLDTAADQALIGMLARLRGQATVVLATQRPSYMQLADSVIVMRDGGVALSGPPDVVLPRIVADAKALARAQASMGRA